MTFMFRSVLFEWCLFHPIRFRFTHMSEQLICWACFANVSKIKASSFACQLESILSHCYSLLNSAGTLYFCRSSNSSSFCNRCCSTGNTFSYRRSIKLVSPIDFDCLQMQQIDRNSTPFGFLELFRHLV